MALTEADLKNLPKDGIDAEDPGKYETLLKDLQGNILKSHGREHSVHLFLKWKSDRVYHAKKWIKDFATDPDPEDKQAEDKNKDKYKIYVTSAYRQAQEAAHFRVTKTEGEIFANVFFSRKGYEALGFDPFDVPKDQPFTMGMKNTRVKEMLKDPEVEEWEKGYQSDIDALILIADDDLNILLQAVNRITPGLREVAEIVHREDGFVLRNENNQVREHFGFADGVSQPLFLKRDIVKARTNDCNFSQWDPRASLDIILVKDYNGKTEDSYGSFLVYRKYEQAVQTWVKYVLELTKKLGKNPNNMADALYAGALVMGRFHDGTPVTKSDIPTHAAAPTNNFNYDADIKGMKCPFQAHTRKTNPRGDTGRVESSQNYDVDFAIEKSRRIARRAISYGQSKDIMNTPDTGSGLLFLCFQADIAKQFNFLQDRWANPDRFVKVGVGTDPVIGQPGCNQDSPVQHKWPQKWGEADTVDYPFQKSITMKGGEYFFAPSISFLQSLV
ncbi:MAG: Dyp-type peroxidase [Rivularia sp. (in: cyanobacteria)]